MPLFQANTAACVRSLTLSLPSTLLTWVLTVFSPMPRRSAIIWLLRPYLVSLNAWNEEDEVELKERCAKYVDAEVNAYLETRSQPVEAMFDYTYAELPDDLKTQRSEALFWDKPH